MDRREALRRVFGGLLATRALDVAATEAAAQEPATSGGYLVPPEFAAELTRAVRGTVHGPFINARLVINGEEYHPTAMTVQYQEDAPRLMSMASTSGVHFHPSNIRESEVALELPGCTAVLVPTGPMHRVEVDGRISFHLTNPILVEWNAYSTPGVAGPNQEAMRLRELMT